MKNETGSPSEYWHIEIQTGPKETDKCYVAYCYGGIYELTQFYHRRERMDKVLSFEVALDLANMLPKHLVVQVLESGTYELDSETGGLTRISTRGS